MIVYLSITVEFLQNKSFYSQRDVLKRFFNINCNYPSKNDFKRKVKDLFFCIIAIYDHRGKKNAKNFQINFSEFLSYKRVRFVFYKMLKSLKFFFVTFVGCSSACNASFSRVFHLSTPKRAKKKAEMTMKLKISVC